MADVPDDEWLYRRVLLEDTARALPLDPHTRQIRISTQAFLDRKQHPSVDLASIAATCSPPGLEWAQNGADHGVLSVQAAKARGEPIIGEAKVPEPRQPNAPKTVSVQHMIDVYPCSVSGQSGQLTTLCSLIAGLRANAAPEWCSRNDGSHHGWMFRCPGCDLDPKDSGIHCPTTGWTFNDDLERPTFSPSILVRWNTPDGPKVCHSFVRDGRIEFLSDCTHALAGQTVDLPDWGGAT